MSSGTCSPFPGLGGMAAGLSPPVQRHLWAFIGALYRVEQVPIDASFTDHFIMMGIRLCQVLFLYLLILSCDSSS